MIILNVTNVTNVTNPLLLKFHVLRHVSEADALPRAERYLMDLEGRGERPHSTGT